MPEIDESRRKLLLGAGGATAAIIAGAAIRESDDGITFESLYSTNRFDAVVEDGPTADSGSAYYADVITSEAASSRVFWERFPESAIIDYRDIDFREKFISLFVSRYWICEPGHLCAASPDVDFRDDRLVYERFLGEEGRAWVAPPVRRALRAEDDAGARYRTVLAGGQAGVAGD